MLLYNGENKGRNINMNIFERIKQFFNRNKTKLLPAGNEITEASRYEITPKGGKEYSETLSPKRALEKNLDCRTRRAYVTSQNKRKF